jgi:predicted transcriptional regulator
LDRKEQGKYFNTYANMDLIEHHLQKEPARKEWYEITEKGREISKYLEDLVATLYGDEQRIPEP